jgi:hypothetical protein
MDLTLEGSISVTVPVKKIIIVLTTNVCGTLVIYTLFRFSIRTPWQAIIECAIMVLGSTAHFLYMRTLPWKLKIPLAVVSAIISDYGKWAIVYGVFGDAI